MTKWICPNKCVEVSVCCLAICILAFSTGCDSWSTLTSKWWHKTGSTAQGKTNLCLLVDRGSKSAADIANELQLKPNRTYDDMIDLGTVLLWQGEYAKASDFYDVGVRIAKNEREVCGALFNKAASQGYYSLRDACNTIDCAARLQPKSLDIAKLRYALYVKSGNQLGILAAQDHLGRLDASLSGHEVLVPATIILAVAICATLYATTTTCVALTPPEDRKEVIATLMSGYAKIAETTPKFMNISANSLGDYILERK